MAGVGCHYLNYVTLEREPSFISLYLSLQKFPTLARILYLMNITQIREVTIMNPYAR